MIEIKIEVKLGEKRNKLNDIVESRSQYNTRILSVLKIKTFREKPKTFYIYLTN